MNHLKTYLPPNNSPSRIFWENYCCWTVNLIGFLMANPSQREEWGNGFHLKQMHTHTHTQAQKNWIKVVGLTHWLTCTFVRDYERSLFKKKTSDTYSNGRLAKATCSFDLYTSCFIIKINVNFLLTDKVVLLKLHRYRRTTACIVKSARWTELVENGIFTFLAFFFFTLFVLSHFLIWIILMKQSDCGHKCNWPLTKCTGQVSL